MKDHIFIWVDFTVRTVIVALVCYLVLSGLFVSEFNKALGALNSIDDRIDAMNSQIKYIEDRTVLMAARNSETLYIVGLSKEESGDIQGAVKHVLMALEVSQINSAKYKSKLEGMVARGQISNAQLRAILSQ